MRRPLAALAEADPRTGPHAGGRHIAMTTRAIDKLRALGLALGSAMVAHQVVVLRAERLAHLARVRRALVHTRPSR